MKLKNWLGLVAALGAMATMLAPELKGYNSWAEMLSYPSVVMGLFGHLAYVLLAFASGKTSPDSSTTLGQITGRDWSGGDSE